MTSLVFALMLAGTDMRLSVGAQGGFPFIIGARASATFFYDERPRFFADLLIEPSAMLQSVSASGGYHVADSVFFVGGRVRFVQLEPVWSRDYKAALDNHLGLGLEAGVRAPLFGGRGLLLVSLHATFLPTAVAQFSTLFGLSAGFAWEVWRQPLP